MPERQRARAEAAIDGQPRGEAPEIVPRIAEHDGDRRGECQPERGFHRPGRVWKPGVRLRRRCPGATVENDQVALVAEESRRDREPEEQRTRKEEGDRDARGRPQRTAGNTSPGHRSFISRTHR